MEFNILIDEHELYEKYPIELVAKNVFDQMEELFQHLDYKFTVSYPDKWNDELSDTIALYFNLWEKINPHEYVESLHIYSSTQPDRKQWSLVHYVYIPLFIFDSHQAIPIINQITQYLHTVEQILNETMRKYVMNHDLPITIHINILPKLKNTIDFYRNNLRPDAYVDEDNDTSSEGLSYKMSNYRNLLNEKLKTSSQYIHPEDINHQSSQQFETITMRVSGATLKRMRECVDVNNLYCIKMNHPDVEFLDTDIPWHIEQEIEISKDVEECIPNIKKCYMNDLEYSCLFIDDKDEILSFFIGNKLQKAAVPIVSKYEEKKNDGKYVRFPCYVLYNPSDEIQTFKIENDCCSTYILELMFADNGKDVFECYFRTDRVCCGPEPGCDELRVDRCRVEVVEDENLNEEEDDDVNVNDGDEEENVNDGNDVNEDGNEEEEDKNDVNDECRDEA